MNTCVWAAGPKSLAAIRAYIDCLQQTSGLPVAITRIEDEDPEAPEAVVHMCWHTSEGRNGEEWDGDEEEEPAHRTMSAYTAAQYHRNLVLLGSQEEFAAAWFASLKTRPSGPHA
jgi:hypothetical protein